MTRVQWLLLMHSVPPKPPYLRAKVMRRLTRLGALVLKRSAYLLPASESSVEDFQWLRQEIKDEGGDAWVVECRFLAGLEDDELRERFRAMRAADYQNLAAEARPLVERLREGGAAAADTALDAEWRRLVRRVAAARQIDFFHADEREEVEALMSTIERMLDTGSKKSTDGKPTGDGLRARTWATRTGVKVDRMSSAWLIRRFIDPAARFVFVPPETALPVPDALRFDMFEGEFTHDGNCCTFEVLLGVLERPDGALGALGQIVHDLDLRDEKYQRPETAGVAAMIAGIVSRFDDDHRRLAESAPLFDALYASLGGEPRAAAPTE
jgi:hypothetical protein